MNWSNATNAIAAAITVLTIVSLCFSVKKSKKPEPDHFIKATVIVLSFAILFARYEAGKTEAERAARQAAILAQLSEEAGVIRTIQLNLLVRVHTQSPITTGRTATIVGQRSAMLFVNGGKTSMFFAPNGSQRWMGPWSVTTYVFSPEPEFSLLGKRLQELAKLDFVSFDMSNIVETAGFHDNDELRIEWSVQVNGRIVAQGLETCPAKEKRGGSVNTVANIKEQIANAMATKSP